jgi:hypothetical protein
LCAKPLLQLKNFPNVNKFLPDQCEYSFFEIRSASEVNGFDQPDKGSGILKHACDPAVPTVSIDVSGKDELTPAVVNIKKLDMLYPRAYRSQLVIPSVAVRSEGGGYEDPWAAFEYTH